MSKQPNSQSSESAKPGGNPPSQSYGQVLANWTRILGASTIALVIATAVGAYFLYQSDQSIKKQVGAAHIQIRAYVGLSQFQYAAAVQKETGKPDVFAGAQLAVTWKNFGVSPAKEFEYWVSAKWYPNETEPDFSKQDAKFSNRITMTLGGGSDMPGAPVFVPASDIQKAITGNGKVFFWGHATYRDVFPETPARNFYFCMIGGNMPSIAGDPASFIFYKPECNYSD